MPLAAVNAVAVSVPDDPPSTHCKLVKEPHAPLPIYKAISIDELAEIVVICPSPVNLYHTP